jgi:hypothetical protein
MPADVVAVCASKKPSANNRLHLAGSAEFTQPTNSSIFFGLRLAFNSNLYF